MMSQASEDSLVQALREALYGGRNVRIKGSEGSFSTYFLEARNVGNPANSIAASVGETDIDLQVKTPFYPKSLSMVFSVVNTSDYIELFLLNETGTSQIKKLGSTHYIAATSDEINFADSREGIPQVIYPQNQYLRIAFQNKSGTAYTFTSAWDLWTPTAFG